ncbi:hypothetical protein [Flavobacterium hydatis]|uniref:Lipoprotein n=1 Tax=Flavobacterium hydatis TaxID=991 RepID=A0A086AT42_FLAHY|nr:hypothetical protein [Flavobacterium hydatis]KFF19856.1 hypothetical protein IW20_01625 [Flavobacterium hydatis]OXA91579.1 hypothetical protein B0A62_18070 [Flavobacterium hydatis]
MIKKLLLASVIISQLAISCSSNDDEPTTEPTVTTPKDETLQEQIARISKLPYSSLAPGDQKVKLEVEANDMLVQMEKTKTSGAIEAIQNLGNLLNSSPADIFGGKNGNEVEDILKVADVYGIYTWNNTEKIWVKTSSSSDLKFIFPAKIKGTENNATFSVKSVSSDIKVTFIDTYGSWSYDPIKKEMIKSPTINDYFFLPTSADATLTIGGAQAATFASSAKYTNGIVAPDQASYKMVLNDGYTLEVSGNKKATDNTGKGSLTYNGKTLVEFTAGSTADIDGLLKDEQLAQYRGKANGVAKIMDNFIIVADTDNAGEAKDDEALEKSLVYPVYPNDSYKHNSDYKGYRTALNIYRQKYSEGIVNNSNKNIKLILVSKKDGTKIADLVQRSEKGDSYTVELPVWVTSKDSYYPEGGYWSWNGKGETITMQEYEEIYFLKFNDNTQVEMSVYFSKGFENFQGKFQDFIKSFNRQ